jgi:hypothetical protein
VLRGVGLLGNGGDAVIKEHNLLFSRTFEDKVKQVSALEGLTHAIDDDWYILKRYAANIAPPSGLHLLLFNPDHETEAEYKQDYKNWRELRSLIVCGMQELARLQRNMLRHKIACDVGLVLPYHPQPNERGDTLLELRGMQEEMRGLEEELVPKMLHLYLMEPAQLSCVLCETEAEGEVCQAAPSAAAITPWVKVAKILGCGGEKTDSLLGRLQLRGTQQQIQEAELVANALHRGTLRPGGRAQEHARHRVAHANMFHSSIQEKGGLGTAQRPAQRETNSCTDLAPFFPLDDFTRGEGAVKGEGERARYRQWQAGWRRSMPVMEEKDGGGRTKHVQAVTSMHVEAVKGAIGIQFHTNRLHAAAKPVGGGVWEVGLEVVEVVAGGPASQSGLIEKGMILVSIDGRALVDLCSKKRGCDTGLEVVWDRIAEYGMSPDGRAAGRLRSLRSFEAARLIDTQFGGIDARLLADAGLCFSNGQVKCQATGAVLPHIPRGSTLEEAMTKYLPRHSPLTSATHLKALASGSLAPPLPAQSWPASTPVHYLRCGVMLGFLPASDSPASPPSFTELDESAWSKVVYVWVRPEPPHVTEPPPAHATLNSPKRVLVDLDRVLLRLRYFEVQRSAGLGVAYRDPWRSAAASLLPAPTSAYTWADMEEVMEDDGEVMYIRRYEEVLDDGRLLYIDHAAKT